jgi:4-hydroxybenzoate polyprenyltransferase
MKRFLFINQVWIAIPRGLLGILASWSVFGDPFQIEALVIGTIALVFFIGAMTTKDIVDADADKRTGIHTLVNTFGVKKAALISLPFMILPYAVVPILIYQGLLDSYFLPLTVFVLPSILIFYLMLQHHESETLENVHAWSLMYVTYLFYAVTFVSLMIFSQVGVIGIS